MTCCDYREMAENTGGIVVRSVTTSGTPTVELNVNVTFSPFLFAEYCVK